MTIKKEGNKYLVMDSAGKKILGTHTSKAKAVKQLQAIESNKRKSKHNSVHKK